MAEKKWKWQKKYTTRKKGKCGWPQKRSWNNCYHLHMRCMSITCLILIKLVFMVSILLSLSDTFLVKRRWWNALCLIWDIVSALLETRSRYLNINIVDFLSTYLRSWYYISTICSTFEHILCLCRLEVNFFRETTRSYNLFGPDASKWDNQWC